MEEKLYYIQNGWIGNSILWWAIDSKGYTTEISKAGKFTEKEALGIITRPEDSAWECDHVDNCLEARKTIIDGQYLNYKFHIRGDRK